MIKKKFLKLVRTFKEGLRNFFRNGWLTIATVSILILTLYVVSATALLGITANTIVKNIEKNVDISIYLNPEVEKEEAMDIRNEIEDLAEVKEVRYVSNDEALESFVSDSGGVDFIQDALDMIGENPLLSSLIVKAYDPSQYNNIAGYIENAEFNESINRINYAENKDKIEKLNNIINTTEKIGMVLGAIFVAIAILITFNTIRLTIYTRKKEFEIMRLVGASNTYVQMPSIFEGIFYGLAASIISMGLILATAKFVSPLTRGAIPYENLLQFYLQYFWQIFGAILLLGVFLGVVSSFIAIRRYLKI